MRLQKTQAAAFWAKKPISLCDIAINFAISVIVVWVSTEIAGFISAAFPSGNGIITDLIGGLFGNKYLILTTITMIIATIFSKPLEGLSGSQELGTYLILPVLLCNRRTCIHQGYLPECTSAAGILCNHGNRKHAVLLRIRQAAEI